MFMVFKHEKDTPVSLIILKIQIKVSFQTYHTGNKPKDFSVRRWWMTRNYLLFGPAVPVLESYIKNTLTKYELSYA